MYPIWHFISSGILVILLLPFLGWQVLWISIGGFFVDVDHYFLYISRFGKFNLIKAYDYFSRGRERFKDELLIFHTVEFIILLVVLSFYWLFGFLIFIGFILHMVLDIIWEVGIEKEYKKTISLFIWLKRHKKIF